MRGGVLTVSPGRAGQEVAIATREAVVGDDLATLDAAVLNRFQADAEAERPERTDGTCLQLDAIRQVVSRLRPGRGLA